MNRTINKLFSVITILAMMLMALPMGSVQAAGTVSLTTLGSPYDQDFNTLASSGTANTTVPTGWEFSESGTNANTTYRAGTGSDNTGDTYSFGASGNTERAFGGLRSGSLVPLIGAQFTNNTGSIITTLDIVYTGEQWRLGQNTTGRSADRLDFQLSTDATSITTGTWTNYDSLDFASPVVAGTVGALNGNVAPNRTAVSFSITGLNIANGVSFWLRWADTDLIPGADDGLSIDDFSLTPLFSEDAPAVLSTFPASGATNVAVNTNITINFSEPINVTGNWFDITCSTSGSHTATVSGGPTTFTLDVDTDFVTSETCTVTVLAANVTDQDGIDPPDNMTVDFITGFSTLEVCGDPETLIHDIQGTGLMSPLNGMTGVSIEGVVVGDFQVSGGLGGYYVQEEDTEADTDLSTSEGIFVFNTSFPVNVGDTVRVKGNVVEFETPASSGLFMTELTNVSNVLVCSTGNSVTSTEVTLPVSAITDFERFEGMFVNLPQALVISEYFNYDRFGEIVLALPLDGETRPFTPTSIVEPGAPAQARALANSLRRITLDDGLGAQNPAFTRHPNGSVFSLTNRFRGGDTVQNAVGVMDFSFGLYRIQPTGPADYASVNPRPAAPEEVGGSVRLAAMNTLNFFLTLDTTTSDASGTPGPCGGNANLDCRGADSNQPLEFNRQRDKLIAALSGLDADVIGLNELENTPGVDPLGDPTRGIVAGLNAIPGVGPYASINTGVIGTDAIRVGLIYRPDVVTPVGDFKLLTSAVDPRFIDTLSRPALAQTFEENATGARFTVVVNHLKSKGSACTGDPDIGDGQGNCNQTRKAAAQALVDWVATDPTGSGDADYIIMGDLNSYAQEDPIDVIKAGADDTPGTFDDYTNLIFQYQGTYAYSYVFDGQAGYLDHALSFPSLTAQVIGAADWHINSDEPDLLDYDTSFKSPAQDAIYEPNGYRSSDHDPVIVGLNPLHFNFSGFLHPIDNAPVVNSVKAGQAVPIKFSLGGDQGLDIFLDGYPRFEFGSCDPSNVDAVEETLTAGGSGLSYDPATDQYTYVWKTEKNWSGKCGTMTIVFDDGSIHKTLFQFTK